MMTGRLITGTLSKTSFRKMVFATCLHLGLSLLGKQGLLFSFKNSAEGRTPYEFPSSLQDSSVIRQVLPVGSKSLAN